MKRCLYIFLTGVSSIVLSSCSGGGTKSRNGEDVVDDMARGPAQTMSGEWTDGSCITQDTEKHNVNPTSVGFSFDSATKTPRC